MTLHTQNTIPEVFDCRPFPVLSLSGRLVLGLALICGILALFVIPSNDLSAQEANKKKSIQFRWQPVARAGGYQVQIRSSDGKMLLNKRTRATSVEIALEPGEYERRVAAVNKFGRVSPRAWSKWQRFRVRVTARPKIRKVSTKGKADSKGVQKIIVYGKNFLDSTQVFLVKPNVAREELPFRLLSSTSLEVTLKPSQYRDGNYSIAVVNPRGLEDRRDNSVIIKDRKIKTKEKEPEEEEETKEIQTFDREDLWGRFWPTLIPGLPGFKRNDNTGPLWAGAFFGSLVMAGLEYDAADTRKTELTDDPLYQAYNNPVLLFGLSQNLDQNQLLFWGYASSYRRAQIERKFERHKRNQVIWSSVATATWIGHYAYENRDYWKWTHLVPGWSHFKKGNTGRGIGWASATGLTGAVVAYTTYRQENLNASRANFRNNALGSFALFNSLLGPSTAQQALFLGSTYDSLEIQNKEYAENVKLQTNTSVAFVTLYLLQIMDATMMEAGQGSLSSGIRETSGSAFASRSESKQKPEIIHEIRWDYHF